jgi:hypothetical protein
MKQSNAFNELVAFQKAIFGWVPTMECKELAGNVIQGLTSYDECEYTSAYAGLFSARSVCHQGDQRLPVTRSIRLSSICDFVDPVMRFLKRGHLCV